MLPFFLFHIQDVHALQNEVKELREMVEQLTTRVSELESQ